MDYIAGVASDEGALIGKIFSPDLSKKISHATCMLSVGKVLKNFLKIKYDEDDKSAAEMFCGRPDQNSETNSEYRRRYDVFAGDMSVGVPSYVTALRHAGMLHINNTDLLQ